MLFSFGAIVQQKLVALSRKAIAEVEQGESGKLFAQLHFSEKLRERVKAHKRRKTF